MTKSLFKGTEPEEPVKLDLSDCKLTSEYILKLNADVSLISFIFELNLAGNPIGQEVCKFKFCLFFFFPVVGISDFCISHLLSCSH